MILDQSHYFSQEMGTQQGTIWVLVFCLFFVFFLTTMNSKS